MLCISIVCIHKCSSHKFHPHSLLIAGFIEEFSVLEKTSLLLFRDLFSNIDLVVCFIFSTPVSKSVFNSLKIDLRLLIAPGLLTAKQVMRTSLNTQTRIPRSWVSAIDHPSFEPLQCKSVSPIWFKSSLTNEPRVISCHRV